MKLFAEILEIEKEKNPKFFQVKVKDKTEAIAKIQEKMVDFVGLKIEKRLHKCFHKEIDEAENQPCVIEKL